MTDRTITAPTDNPVGRVNGAHPVGTDWVGVREAGDRAVAEAHRQAATLSVVTDIPTHRPGRHHADPTGPSTDRSPTGRSRATRRVLTGVAVALSVVILAPLTLSAQDLYTWAVSPTGLNLDGPWPFLVPVALDLAAASCIGMTIVSAWRRERSGIFSHLVWVFALVSAFAQYRHGLAERAAGRAQDLWWAMPAFAVLGPFLLEATLHRIRRWARKDAGEQHSGAAGFGSRWLPGVALRETLAAWATSRREGIDKAADAVQFVRDRRAVKALPAVEAVHYAFGAVGSTDVHSARLWLSARGVSVRQADLDDARQATGRPIVARQADSLSPVDERPPGSPAVPPTVAPDSTTVALSPVDPPRPAPVARQVRPTTPRQAVGSKPSPVGKYSAAAVANAADLRKRYPDSLPSDYAGRQATGWSRDRYVSAKVAYLSGADLTREATA